LSKALRALRELNQSPRRIVPLYLLLMSLSELMTFLVAPQLGVLMYGILLIALIVHASVLWQEPVHRVLLSFTFSPIIRIVSLAVPLSNFPLIQAYAITGLPLILSALVSIRSMRMPLRDAGLGLGRKPLIQLVVVPTGILIGFAEYLVLRPAPMIESLTWQNLYMPALVLLISTGFCEELMFRGIMQSTLRPIYGSASIVIVSGVFAIMHIGYRSAIDLIVVLVAGLLFGVVSYRTRSIWGVSLAHGLTNVMLFLVYPLLLADLGI